MRVEDLHLSLGKIPGYSHICLSSTRIMCLLSFCVRGGFEPPC
nr:MAG TPA: hypothetical protein [Crassvirales sp.]